MIDKILNDSDFIKLMQKHCFEVLQILTQKKIEFSIVCNTKFTEFDPALPKELDLSANAYTMFVLAGYTFESLKFDEKKLSFHAGFGPNDFDTFVSVDLGAITQIQVENDILFVNFSFYKRALNQNELIKQSMNIFLKNNPKK